MTDASFSALAQLLRLRASPSREAARLVLVHGMRPAEAARSAGCTPQAASNAIARCRRGIELALAVTSGMGPS